MKTTMKMGLSMVLAGIAVSGYSAVLTNWVADSSFEGLSLWSAPNPDTSPWYSTRENKEADYGWVARELTLVNTGSQAAKFSVWGDGQANQDLELRVDSNKTYEVRFSLRLDNKSTNTAHTNDTDLAVLISTSPVLGSNAVWKTTTYGIAPSTTNVWEEKVVRFDGADLADRQGEYITLGLRKWNKFSEYWLYIDDISFGEYVQDPVPDSLLVGWDTTTGAPDYSAMGVTGVLFAAHAYELDATAGSSDGTFGSTNSGASIQPAAYAVRLADPGNNDTVGFQIENQTDAPIELDSIGFDYARWYDTSPRDIELLYSYGDLEGITNNTVIHSATGIPETAKTTDYTDFDISLASLPDQVLAVGEKASFELRVSNAAGIWANGAFDNIAIFGGPIAATGYEGWAIGYGLTEPKTGDDDKDGLSNIYEYGLGGDPTDPADQGIPPGFSIDSVGGTNYFGYVHPQLSDPESGIAYSLALCTDLVYGNWATNAGYTITGTNVTGEAFDFVTNITETVDGKKFIRLIIE